LYIIININSTLNIRSHEGDNSNSNYHNNCFINSLCKKWRLKLSIRKDGNEVPIFLDVEEQPVADEVTGDDSVNTVDGDQTETDWIYDEL